MNKQLHLFLIVLVVTILSAMVGTKAVAQTAGAYRELTTSKNVVVADTISGLNLGLSLINPLPQHGNVQVTILSPGGGGNPYVYRVKYTPDPGFTGVDTFALEYNYYGNYPFLTYRAFKVNVFPTLIKTNIDFATTPPGTQVAIDVTNNDIASNGPLTLTEIPSASHGSAVISGNQVLFTPDAGFNGAAHFNYTVCDALGQCKTGSGTISVQPSTPANDSLRVFVAKNTVLHHPLEHNGFQMFQAPSHGSAILGSNGQSFRYNPVFNFTGIDSFTLINNSYGNPIYQFVKVHVLNTPTPNVMALEDVVYTPVNKPITFNVKSNDIGNLLVRGWNIPNNLPGSVSNTTGTGNVTFTPANNFTGVATFYYRLGNPYTDLEIGKVNVVVGNLAPTLGTYGLATPAETPVVINYKLPFIGFNFNITDQPDHGTCVFYPGYSTHTISGQPISGYNLLIYMPELGATSDEFEVDYCIAATGQCHSVKVAIEITPVFGSTGPYCIGDECVWAGDANDDGIVNNKDILPIGYLMGQEGTSRSNATLEWYGQYGNNWSNPFYGVAADLKHADTDGSGIIESADTAAIALFYGKQHRLTPEIPSGSKGLPFFLVRLTPPNPQPGDLVEYDVYLGSESQPVTDLYGFTFDLRLSPQILDSAFHIDYLSNSWLNTNAPYLEFFETPTTGKLESAFTRTNGVTASGWGKIAKFDYIIVDIIQGVKFDTTTQGVFEIVYSGNTMNGEGFVDAQRFIGSVDQPIRTRDDLNKTTTFDFNDHLRVLPSPASQFINLHLNGNELLHEVVISDLSGRTMAHLKGLSTESLKVDVSSFPNGIYFAMAQTGQGRVVRKFEVVRN